MLRAAESMRHTHPMSIKMRSTDDNQTDGRSRTGTNRWHAVRTAGACAGTRAVQSRISSRRKWESCVSQLSYGKFV